MSLWKYHHNMDHLRRRAEYLIGKGTKRARPSAASSGHKRIMADARSTDIRDGLNATPSLSDMSGSLGLKK
ncbi:hypothetical protein [Magnetovibrio sp.]|uniref:hypothetical protein n=1 Tax=Magnetovibrio sp. TaxID=2024836 RepID=UPI002F94707D